MVLGRLDVWLQAFSLFGEESSAKEFPKGPYLRKKSRLSLQLVVLVLREEGRPPKKVDRLVNNGGCRTEGKLKPLLMRLLCSTACTPEGRSDMSSSASSLLELRSKVAYDKKHVEVT